MFPNDLWIVDPNYGELYKFEQDMMSSQVDAPIKASSVLVSQDMVHVYVASQNDNKVVRYRNGVRVLDIQVGKAPTCICENSKGHIYVANYGDNTVSKIVNGVVTATIRVHGGPRGIIANSRDKIYVTCYNSNTLDVIENDILVESLRVEVAPRAITCDTFDNIWITNYGSNTVSKFLNDKLVVTIDLNNISRGPVDIVGDSNGRIYVANYLGNDVTVIEKGKPRKIIPVNAAPTALAVTSDDSIYVLSEIEGTVQKIVKDSVVNTIPVCTNPIGYGDFTGCSTYNIYHDGSGSTSNVPIGGWTMSSMSSEIQNLLGSIKSKAVATSADLVSYDSTDFPTVQDALDRLLNADPTINKFTATRDTFEYGEIVTSLSVNWSFNKPMKSAIIKYGSTTIADLAQSLGDPVEATGNRIISGFTISNPALLQLEIEDEKGNQATASLQIKFQHRFLYGTVDNSENVNLIAQPTLATLNKSPILENPYGKYFEIDCGFDGDRVPIVGFPTSWHIQQKQLTFLNGYSNNWVQLVIPYTNIVGGNITYDVFVFDYPLYGSVIGTVVDLI